jgi:hypothetical protein
MTLQEKLTTQLNYIHHAQVNATGALKRIAEAAEVIRVQTTTLREALYTIERSADRAHRLLDELETSAGLVDEDGKRYDEAE